MSSEIDSQHGSFGFLDSYRIIQKGNAEAFFPFQCGSKVKEFTPFGRPLDHIPIQFVEDVSNFQAYLESTSTKFFKITNSITFKASMMGPGETVIQEKTVPYVHRWTDTYRKSLLAKLYKLEEYCKADPEILKNITMITPTVSQRGKDQEEALLDLMRNYKKLLDVLRHELGAVDYFYILEPHDTGYVHMHIIYFHKFTEAEKDHIYDLWENKYGAGSRKAFNFSEPRASIIGHCQHGNISYIRSYFMKYISKGLRTKEMPKNVLLFNALLKKTKIRMWNCSRHLSKVMSRDEGEENEFIEYFECLSVELHDSALGEDEKDSFIKQVYPRKEDPGKYINSGPRKEAEKITPVFIIPEKPEPGRVKPRHHMKRKRVYKGYQGRLDLTSEEDYGEVDGITVTDDEEETLRFLQDEGY